MLERLGNELDITNFAVLNLVADGDHVVALLEQANKSTGQPIAVR
jgi:hypothetical protein